MLNLHSLNQKYNWLRLQVGGGGGGSVNNPMTANLDGGGYSITNVDQLQSNSLTTQDATISTSINNTEPPKYVNLGALTSGNDYELANINTPADAEGDIVIHLRALQTPIKQEVLLSVIAYTDRVDIVVLNHLSESDTLVFTNFKYGTDGVKNSLVFTCGTSTTDCEYTVYQNQTNKGTGTYGSFFNPSFVLTPITLTSVYGEYPLNLNTVGGTSNINTSANLIASDTQTGSLGTNEVRSLTAPNPINLLNDIDGLSNSLKNFGTTETFNIASPSGTITSTADIDLTNTQNIKNGAIIETANLQAPATITDINVNTQINMNNLDINGVQNIRTDGIREATLGNDIIVHDEMNMQNNTIKNLPNPVNPHDAVNKTYADSLIGTGFVTNPMNADLDGGNFNISNTNSISATSIDGNTVTGNAGGTIESRGEFIHGFGTATNFSVGGSDITLAPSGNIKVKDFALTKDFIDYTNATSGGIATLNINDTTTTLTGSNDRVVIEDFATLDIGNNGIFQLDNPPSFVSQPNQLGVAQLPDTVYGTGNMDVLSLYSSNFNNNDPLIVSPSFNHQIWIKDVTATIPLNAGTQWNNASDGLVAPLYDFDPISAIAGETDGTDNVGTKLNINDTGYLIGIELHNRSLSGGWICSTSNASLEVVYYSSGTWRSFPAPLYLAGATSTTIGFNQNIFTLGYLNFVKTFGGNGHSGIWLGIKLNIPLGEFIDIQDPSNAMVSGTKSQIYNLRIL